MRGDRDRPLILGADNHGLLMWYVDTSFAVHPNMRRQYGKGTDRGQTASESIFLLKIQGVDISSPIEFPCSFHTIVLGITNR